MMIEEGEFELESLLAPSIIRLSLHAEVFAAGLCMIVEQFYCCHLAEWFKLYHSVISTVHD